MIPIRDENPTHHKSYVTIGLIAVNVAVFLLQVRGVQDVDQDIVYKYGFVPAQLVHGSAELRDEIRKDPPLQLKRDQFGRTYVNRLTGLPVMEPVPIPIDTITAVPAWVNIFTCMFLHGGWMHLLGNMLYLWIFGNNIEDKLGPVLFTVFYLGTGVAGNLAHTWQDPGLVPLVGASGAISGVMGAYVLLFPRAKVLTLIPAGWYWFTVRMPAWVFLGVYIVVQNLFPVFRGSQGAVAYWAHIGGFAAGAALIYLFPHRKPPQTPARPVTGRFFDGEADFEI